MLPLRRGVVPAAGDPGGPMRELEVRLGGERRPAGAAPWGARSRRAELFAAALAGGSVLAQCAA
jgi:hypothetical protein